jgi:quercetin dioxygenase-like cupin family protein
MQTIRLSEIAGTKFPTGRHTRVMIGAHSPVQAENFVMGYVVMEPNGSVPIHTHEQEEVYFIAEGKGTMQVGDEKQEVEGGMAIYLEPNVEHELVNGPDGRMVMIFVYSPAGVVKHWEEEQKNKKS